MAYEQFIAGLGVEQAAIQENCRVARLRGILAAMGVQPRFRPIRLYSGTSNEGAFDTLEFEVDLSVPQAKVYDIRSTERLLVYCEEPERLFPSVWALRESFPLTPHQNAPLYGSPKSLCLYEEKFDEMALVWNPTDFLSRLVDWLEKTATNTLHPDDQQLEPFFYAANRTVVLPRGVDLYAPDNLNTWLTGYLVTPLGDENIERALITLQVAPTGAISAQGLPLVSVLALRTEPTEHGVIQVMPRNLGDLAEMLRPMGIDLVARLRDHIQARRGSPAWNPGASTLILVQVPLQRHGRLERTQTVAFMCQGDARDLGLAVDILSDDVRVADPRARYPVWQPLNGVRQDNSRRIGVDGVNVIDELTKAYAVMVSDSPEQLLTRRLGFVGHGALGSPVFSNFARSGANVSFVADEDILLPHNLVKHLLQRGAVGFNKALGSAQFYQELWGELPVVVSKDIKSALDVPAERTAIEGSDLIVDCAASQAASRTLALDFGGTGRRAVCFVSPKGQDSVCLAEDAQRALKADKIEAQYFRYLIRNPLGETHLTDLPRRSRYGFGCRDRTAIMAPERMGLHVSLVTAEIKAVLVDDAARAVVWSQTGEVLNRIDIPLVATRTQRVGSITVVWDEEVQTTMHRLRREHLPEETGGPLVGYMDMQRQIIYIVDALPAPPDSDAGRGHFIRGSAELDATMEDISRRTGQTVQLVGDWHSHPLGNTATASPDDYELVSIVGLTMASDERPGLIAIAGEDGETRFYVSTLPEEQPDGAVLVRVERGED